jgi:hypothetical protein
MPSVSFNTTQFNPTESLFAELEISLADPRVLLPIYQWPLVVV